MRLNPIRGTTHPTILTSSLSDVLAGSAAAEFAQDYEVERERVRIELPAKARGLFQRRRFKVMYGGRGGAVLVRDHGAAHHGQQPAAAHAVRARNPEVHAGLGVPAAV